ncbi:probable ubiquitin-like-specific protease 2B isoform X2 [Durio zibethinus]|uniref:Probable ubiquitin-like-specific protease 2B isoform X2 n=1 Tax=Durio zibethinus TaxID=66656 RepID=A0A6P5XU62_DURZI|nr:probable ubiquitin-like-specific protease 2B isoform X2 [Durio zibethinus]
MKNGLEVLDFKEESEISELAADKYLSKLKNPNMDDPATLKHQFLEFVAQGAAIQRKEMDDVPSIDVDAIGGDCSFDGAAPAGLLGTGEKGFVLKEGNIEPDVSPASKSMYSEQQADLEKDSLEPRSTFPELELRDSCSEAPSPGNIQLNCALSNSALINEPVDLSLDANESMSEGCPSSPASDVVDDDDVSLNGNVSDHCIGNIPVDNIDRTIVICSDYVLYQDNYYTGMSVFFSPSGIKIEGSTVSEHQGTFCFERGIDDIINIDCQWFQRVGNVTVNLKVLSKVAVEAENTCGTSAVEEIKFALIDPKWSDKQEVIISLNFKYPGIWNIVLDPLTGIDGDDSLVQKSYFPNFDEPFEEVIYPAGDFDAVSISKRDVDLLQPETFINDTIIDFYIKYLKNQKPEERQRFHFFNSFFFRKLADLDKDPSSISDGRAAFLRVHKWTRKLDMFGKDYIFIPINFNLHWSLIVICHPGEVAGFKDEDLDKSSKVPCILHMDSIKGNHAGLKNLVQSYLWEEWKERHKETSEDLSSKFLNLRFVSLELPQQENSFDCGLFLLHYLELFLAEAPPNFNPFKITKFSNFLNLSWFPPTEASLKRTLIQKLIFELLEIRSQEISSSDCSDEHHSSKSPEKIENENGVEFISESFSPEVACHGNLDSQAGQGIEMTLLASSSMRNMESVNNSGLVVREFFESGVTAGSLLGRFPSFVQQPSYYNMNGAISPREQEDVQTGQQFVYLASGETGFLQLTGITPQACEVPYPSRGFVMGSSRSHGISMQGEHEVDTSLETSSASHDDDDDNDDDDVGIVEKNPIDIEDNVDPIQKQDTDQEQSQFVENVELPKKGFMYASIEVLGTFITEVPGPSEDTDKIHDSTEDADLLSKDNLPVFLHQNRGADQDPELVEKNAEMVENNEARGDDVQMIGDLPSQDISTVSLHKNPSMVLNQVNQDSELIEKNSETVENDARADDVQMIGDDLSQDNSTVLPHQNPSVLLNQLDQDLELVESKEARGDAVQMIGDDLPSEDNSTLLLNQNPGMGVKHLDQDSEVVENKDSGDDLSAEIAGQPAAKRIRLTPSLDEKADS